MSKDKKLENKLYKTTENILKNYIFLDGSINKQEKELESLENDLKGLYIESEDYERDSKGTSGGGFTGGISKVTENKIIRKEKIMLELIPNLEKKIDRKLNQLNRDKNRMKDIEIAINNLSVIDSRAKDIIEMYFFERRKVAYICEKVFLEEAQVHRIKSLGIKAIRNQIFGFDALEEDDNLISRLKSS